MGVRIAFTDPETLIQRCDVTDARIATGQDGVQDGAVIPAGIWQPLSPAAAEQFRAGPDDDPAIVTELVRVLAGRSLPAPGRPLIEYMADYDPFDGRHKATFLAFNDEPPGQATTTVDPSIGLRIGIHLDNHDKLNLIERNASRRRLGLNLGPGIRYLVLGTVDMFDICSGLGTDPERHFPHTDDIRQHIRSGRPLGLLRIRLDPGEAYIAPTEIVPHDGSTSTATQPSRIAFWLGRWPLNSLRALE